MSESFEIERRFLVKTPPPDLSKFRSISIIQGYLPGSSPGSESRVRLKGEEPFRSEKQGTGMMRIEKEYIISRAEFDRCMESAIGLPLQKMRYFIPEGERTIEFDVYLEALAGLMIAEVEFPSLEESAAFIPPRWFGEEITENPRYNGVELALRGIAALYAEAVSS